MYKENFEIVDIKENNECEIIVLNKESNTIRPKISVIIPVFQEEKILENTINYFTSEFKSKYNLELIVSDGGSLDNTTNIAKKYADKLIIHKSSRKQTISEGRNNGAMIASGDLLVFINGDTIPSEPNIFFDKITNIFFKSNLLKEEFALACKVSMKPEEMLIKDKIFYFLHNYYVKLLNKIGIGMARGECQIMPKILFNKVNGYNSLIAAGEDFDLYSRIAKVSKIKYFDDLIVYESPRRFRKYGYIKVLLSWAFNSLAVIFFGKSISKDWEAVR